MKDSEVRIGMDAPSNHLLYGASIVSILLSLATVKRNPPLANFFGLWAPTILGLGILWKENKLLEISRNQNQPAF